MPAEETDARSRVTAAGGEARAPAVRRTGSGWRVQLARAIVFAVILGLWQLADGRWLPDYLISSPSQIAQVIWHLITGATPGLPTDFLATAEELVLGYVIGVVGGVAVGVVLGYWRLGASLFNPLIAAINGVPKIALAPLFLIWFGIGIQSKVAIASMTVFFVMFYNTYVGIVTMPMDLTNVLRVMGAGRLLVIRKVTLPQITGPLLAGMRASVPFAMIGVIVGEFIASDHGIGFMIDSATQNFDSATVFAGIAFLMAIIIVGMGLVSLIERRLLRWQRD